MNKNKLIEDSFSLINKINLLINDHFKNEVTKEYLTVIISSLSFLIANFIDLSIIDSRFDQKLECLFECNKQSEELLLD